MLYNTRAMFAMNSNEAAFMVNFMCSLGIQREESGSFLELISGGSTRSLVIHGLLTKLNYLALNRWFVLYFAYAAYSMATAVIYHKASHRFANFHAFT